MGKTSLKKYTEIYRICGASLKAQSKESACNEGDLGSVPGLGRCPGEGNGYPLQYSLKKTNKQKKTKQKNMYLFGCPGT